MEQAIWAYVCAHGTEWVFAFVAAGLAWMQRYTMKRLKKSTEEYDAIRQGVQALLRERVVDTYNKYKDKQCFPIYARESMKKVYEAYTGLGGNDVAHDLYEKMRNWDTDEDREE